MSESAPKNLPVRLENLARMCFFAAVALSPLFFLPLPGIPFFLAKTAVFGTLLVLALLLFLAAAMKRGEVRLPRSVLLVSALILLTAYALSASFSQNPYLSWFGGGTETSSVFFIALSFLAVFLSSALLTRLSHLRVLLSLLCGVAFLSALFQYAVIILNAATSFGALAPTDTLVGRWNELGVLLGLATLLSVIALQLGASGRMRIAHALVIAAAIPLLFLVSFTMLWGILFLSAAIALCLSWIAAGPGRFPPLFLAGLAIVSGVFFLVSDEPSLKVGNLLGIASIEARPSLSSTYAVGQATYGEGVTRAFFGSGPNTFTEQWMLQKPADVTRSAFWRVDFESGFGTTPTAFVEGGLLAGAAWLFFLGCIIALAIVRMRREGEDARLGLSFALGALFLFVVASVYPLGQTLLLYLFILAGAARAAGAGEQADIRISLTAGPRDRALAGLALACLAGVSLVVGFILVRASSSEAFYQLAARAESVDTARGHAFRALAFSRSDRNLRLAAQIGVVELQAIAKGDNTETTQARFESVLRPTLDFALEAVRKDPRNYLNWLALGEIYDFLSRLGVSGAQENAKASYTESIGRNPSNPALYLSLAKLEGFHGNYSSARGYVDEALERKPNFTEAILYTVQMEYSRGNIAAAIRAARAAAATEPQNPTRWFELGLLLDASGDAKGAIDALKGTLAITPEHANAKYFLGLVLEKVGRRDEAVALFEELREDNPDNRELPVIISNVRLGRKPFAGSSFGDPIQRSAAPLTE